MIQKGLWQERTIREIRALLEANDAVRALLLKGSCANLSLQVDTWSDVDIIIVVADGALETFFPTTAWLAPLGDVYTFSQSSNELTKTTRVCFTDFRRIDCVFLEESDVQTQVIQSEAIQLLFSRSQLVNKALVKDIVQLPPASVMTAEQFDHLVNDFWFKGMLTTCKVMRNDLLIATHLALALIQDTCVLEMVLRDRALGTSHHREGGWGNDFIAHLGTTHFPFTARGILESVKQSSTVFDDLAKQWSSDYHEQRHPLLAWIRFAQETVAE
ncbi:hypothetical protein EPA93_12495 [Ktedonosporobacter rubrisoli]|uniref:Nucleotidyltransferase domain-containing protein n=1 Tax=Ktedonosporobacter rubrisoli TaxID=2509675 RepID=A0A4P6JN98_KTERU|nr:aminoglycoside 6-adenylyltransferase [Ktedonosporobacter rubrisoli]QBD76778.1 hypothetical protein EPA93_12495 [Ktedonosporobacter rubrisoli]